jgi:ubiquinone/menaquinone biosynthesis C-methylase UbiE
VPQLTDAEVLDFACGQGLATRALAGAGAPRVVGVDASAAMIELARAHDVPPGLTYVEDDTQRLSRFDDAGFDGVTCQLGLMDIPDLDATLAASTACSGPGAGSSSSSATRASSLPMPP